MIEKIKIPDTCHDMKIDKVPFYLELVEMAGEKPDENFLDKLDPVQVSDLNSIFFGKEHGYFDRFTDHSNRVLLSEIIISSAKYKPEQPRKDIEIEGVKYVLNLDFTDQPVSFHRDLGQIEPKENYLDILGFMYIEEGFVYNELDKTNRVKNPRKKRSQALKDSFTLAQFIDLQDFFLSSWNALKPFSSSRQKEIAKVQKRN